MKDKTLVESLVNLVNSTRISNKLIELTLIQASQKMLRGHQIAYM